MLQNILRSRFQSSSRFFSNLRYVNLSDSRSGSLIKVGCVFLMAIFRKSAWATLPWYIWTLQRSLILVRGNDRIPFLQSIITNDIQNLEVLKTLYSFMLNAKVIFEKISRKILNLFYLLGSCYVWYTVVRSWRRSNIGRMRSWIISQSFQTHEYV